MLAAVCVAPELHRLLPLELDRVDGDDVLGAGHAGALHGVDPDARRSRRPPPCRPAACPARFTAEPQPVATPHDTSATASSGRSASTLMTDCLGDAACARLNVPSLANSEQLLAADAVAARAVGDHPLGEACRRRASQRFWRPVEQ